MRRATPLLHPPLARFPRASAITKSTLTSRKVSRSASAHSQVPPSSSAPEPGAQPPSSSHPDTIQNDRVKRSSTQPSAARESESEPGALSQRLASMTDEALESSPRSASKAISEAEFSPELRTKLEERIASASANFSSDHASQIAFANVPESAGQGTRSVAGAPAWTGTESIEDATLRMLNDARKPLRIRSSSTPGAVIRPPTRIDTGRSSSKGQKSSGTRLANARDKSSLYSSTTHLSEEDRRKLSQELKDRFSPHARAVPSTIQGLASLANERIEDAISRGAFRNNALRGQKIERDHNAASPFLDTTEYLMNKIIQKQDVVPPWIEKQQELSGAVARFRGRLRAEWKRHAARVIASKGRGLEDQCARARGYADAEMRLWEGETNAKHDHDVRQETLSSARSGGDSEEQPHVSQISAAGVLSSSSTSPSPSPASPQESASPAQPPTTPTLSPFRDPTYLTHEQSFLSLSITHLNSLTRSYNLVAPQLAQKPYFSLDRELAACYRDVAPLLEGELRERARVGWKDPAASQADSEDGAIFNGGVGARFGAGEKARVRDEAVGKRYGLKQLWRDIFSSA